MQHEITKCLQYHILNMGYIAIPFLRITLIFRIEFSFKHLQFILNELIQLVPNSSFKLNGEP